MSKTNLVSVIIVNYNGLRWLSDCLDSIRTQSYNLVEVILVDNASTDDSRDFVAKKYPEVKILKQTTNIGFAAGCNRGYKASSGKYILLLNNDTVIPADFIKTLIFEFENIPHAGVIQPKIVQMDHPDQLDSCGGFWTDTTMLYYVGNKKSSLDPNYKEKLRIFTVKGVAVFTSKRVVEDISLFHDDFWCYYEETDFCHRAWNAGYECWYTPATYVKHANGGTSLSFDNNYIQFHNFKNKLSSFIYNFEVKTLIKILPIYTMMVSFISLYNLSKGNLGFVIAIIKSYIWNLRNLPSILHKRKKIQAARVMSDQEIFQKVKKTPSWIYFVRLLKNDLGSFVDEIDLRVSSNPL